MASAPAAAHSKVTRLLANWREGDDSALHELTPLVYDELRRIAGVSLAREHGTIQPTALVHEFYLKVAGLRDVEWKNRAQFVATAAKVMRNLLVDRARHKLAAKSGGGVMVASIEEVELPSFDPAFDLIDLDHALRRLQVEYPRHAQVVELVFFGGLNAEEAAAVLSAEGTGTSRRTVERDWRFAKAWLQNELCSK